jgi:Do/DeqQ family serine protease
VIIDGKRGLILTNAHVIANAGTITVVLQDDREFESEIVGVDPDFDLAVLRIRFEGKLPTVEMGSSDDLMIGETVIAIGNPFGFSHTVTTGVISALSRSIRTDDRVYHEFIQTDASINPGNSGGPLLNINGELIGINTAIYAKAQGIGFAIPISKARKIISDLIEHGEVIEAWIGLIVQNITAGLSRYLDLPKTGGVIVKNVESASPAQKAGVRESDVLVRIGERAIASDSDYQSAMRSISAGQKTQITIWRDGKSRTLSVTPTRIPGGVGRRLADRLLGISVQNIAAAHRRQYGISAQDGVVISEINPQCRLARIGARVGDLIRRFNELPIRDARDFEQAVIKYRHKNSVIILLQRGDQGYYITVEI